MSFLENWTKSNFPSLKLDAQDQPRRRDYSNGWYGMMICILNINKLCDMFEQHAWAYRLEYV